MNNYKGIKLGVTAIDRITGFRGVVTGIVEYISGCNQALVVPRVKPDGTAGEAGWYDLQRLDIDGSFAVVTLDNGDKPGFDQAPPKR